MKYSFHWFGWAWTGICPFHGDISPWCLPWSSILVIKKVGPAGEPKRYSIVWPAHMDQGCCLNHALDLRAWISKEATLQGSLVEQTSKNLFNHHTWNTPSPSRTPSWKMLHHFTLAFVLSAVFLCVRSLITIYCCSSLTCETSWKRAFTEFHSHINSIPIAKQKTRHTLSFQWICSYLRLGHIHDPMHVKWDFLWARRRVLVAKTIGIFTINLSVKGVVARRDASFKDIDDVGGVLDLLGTPRISINSSNPWYRRFTLRLSIERDMGSSPGDSSLREIGRSNGNTNPEINI